MSSFMASVPPLLAPRGVEVAEELGTPLLEGAAQAGDLTDRAGGERVQYLFGDLAAGRVRGLVVHGSDLLRALPREFNLDVRLVRGERRGETCALPVGQVLLPGAQDVPDPVQRVVLASAVPVELLLNPAADLIDHVGGELDDVERVQHRAGVLETIIDRVLVPVERVQRRDLHSVTKVFAAVGEPVGVHLPGPPRDEVEQAGSVVPVGIWCQVDHPGEFFRATAAVLDRLGPDVVPRHAHQHPGS